MTYALAILGMILTVAGLVTGAIVWVTSEKRWLSRIGFAVMLIAFLIIGLVTTREVYGADLKPVMFPASEAKAIEKELGEKGVKRDVLPSPTKAAGLGYGCGNYDTKIEQLVKLYDQGGRHTEHSRLWKMHLGHIWEFSLNSCKGVERDDRFKVAHSLYWKAGDEMRGRRVAAKESQRLREIYERGGCDEAHNCKKKLLKEVRFWERRATY